MASPWSPLLPSLPLSHASRKRLLETVSSADRMRLIRGSADSPPQHSPSLSRLSPNLDADGGKRYFGSKLLCCEAALAEALEADGGDRSTATADEADVRARKIRKGPRMVMDEVKKRVHVHDVSSLINFRNLTFTELNNTSPTLTKALDTLADINPRAVSIQHHSQY